MPLPTRVAAALGVPQTPALVAAPIGVNAAEWTGWYLVRPSRFAQFAYLDEVRGLTRIVWEDSALMLRPLQGTVARCIPWAERSFAWQVDARPRTW